jgi:D-alanyl-D-alanine carboxypeptidase/D-alanyl-D-alanine-endopeptidase (penicillin-binding protein 4)
MRSTVLLVTFLLPLASVRAADSLEARVDAVLGAPGFANGQWGVLVVDARTGTSLCERNADRLFCPASVTKLFSTAAAWVDLGPDYRFRTPVRRLGEVDSAGVLHGDLILVASGDLSLGGRTQPDGTLAFTDNDHTYSGGSNFTTAVVTTNPLAGLQALARGVRDAGIRRVDGDVLVDDRLFDPARSTGSGPSQVLPIVVNDNVVDLVVTPAPNVGAPAMVRAVPDALCINVESTVTTEARGSRPHIEVKHERPGGITVGGHVPIGHAPIARYVEMERPAEAARALLIEALAKTGVATRGNGSDRLPARDQMAELPLVTEFVSPPLRESIRVILKVSHNLHASTLPLLLAANHGERTLLAGLRREAARLHELGVPMDAVCFGGGAGGSRADLVSPRATVALLRAMAARPDFAAFRAALPILGVDGTLSKAVPRDSPARGHAWAKTGTFWVENDLNGRVMLTSKALAGYLETASGRTLVLAAFVNNLPLQAQSDEVTQATAAVGRQLGLLCETLYQDK